MISPLLVWLKVDVAAVHHIAEFGVVMMLFLIGLELKPQKLWSMRARLLGLGSLQVVLTMACVVAIAYYFGQSLWVSIAIGMVLSLSSTAIVLQTLNEKGLLKSDGGEASFAVLLFQDIAVIPMLAMMPLLTMPELVEHANSSDASHTASAFNLHSVLNEWQLAIVTLGVILLVVVGGRFVVERMMDFIAMTRLRELFTAAALLFVTTVSLLMMIVGLSPALGAFIAGVALANSQYRHQLEKDIEPFRALLLGLFFITVGAMIDFQLLQQNALAISAATIALILLKLLILFGLAWAFNLQMTDRWLFALGLSQAGEFGFVLLSFALDNQVMPTHVADQLLLVIALSMLMTPMLYVLHQQLFVKRAYLFNRKQKYPKNPQLHDP